MSKAVATSIKYLVDQYQSPHAGTEGQLLELLRHLDRSRYEPSLILLRGSEYVERNPFPCPVSVLGITKLASANAMVGMLRLALSLKRQNVRIVHCFFNDSALIAPLFLKLVGIRVLVSRRDMGFWYTAPILAALRVVRWFVDGYIANSKTVKQRVQALEHVPEHKIRVIHNGYSMEDVAATDCAAGFETMQGDCVIGIVANLRPIKRIDTLLTAFALVRTKYSNARLVIVGDTSSEQARSTREQLHALARELRITDAVIFTGSVSNARALIQKFSVAVLCSESEGMSNALIEYMRMRRPIVCTNTGGNPELVQHGHNGFLFPVGDAHALAKHLLALLGDRALARQFGEAGYAITASYTVSRMVDQHMAYYDEVLRGSHRSSSTEGRSHSHRARCISRAPTPRE